MSSRITKSSIERLGERLRRAAIPDAADLAALEELLALLDPARAGIEQVLIGLGYHATSRLKSTPTLVEKLRRERSRLYRVRDIIGARVVVTGGRTEQDSVVADVRHAA